MPNDQYNKRKWLILPPITAGLDVDVTEVHTTQSEIREMAGIVAEAGGDPAEFLTLLKQDAAEFGVASDDVYDEEIAPESDWAYQFDSGEVERLRELSCQARSYGRDSLADSSAENREELVDRLAELCSLLETAIEIDVPPKLHQS